MAPTHMLNAIAVELPPVPSWLPRCTDTPLWSGTYLVRNLFSHILHCFYVEIKILGITNESLLRLSSIWKEKDVKYWAFGKSNIWGEKGHGRWTRETLRTQQEWVGNTSSWTERFRSLSGGKKVGQEKQRLMGWFLGTLLSTAVEKLSMREGDLVLLLDGIRRLWQMPHSSSVASLRVQLHL